MSLFEFEKIKAKKDAETFAIGIATGKIKVFEFKLQLFTFKKYGNNKFII